MSIGIIEILLIGLINVVILYVVYRIVKNLLNLENLVLATRRNKAFCWWALKRSRCIRVASALS